MFFDTDSAFIPYISDKYIDSVCSNLVRRFDPSVFTNPHPVNIALLMKKMLHLNIRYEHLSCDGSVLGLAVFTETDKLPVYNKGHRRAVYTHASENDVFIDMGLTECGKSNRMRFTLAHEAGHILWHKMYYQSRVLAASQTVVSCEREDIGVCPDRSMLGRLSKSDLIEYQANRSASALLMPREAVQALFADRPAPRTEDDICDRILLTAGTFRVSDLAARFRLLELGLIPAEDEINNRKAV